MAPIAIKFVGRGHTRLAVKQVDLLNGALFKVWRALRRPELLQSDLYHQNRPLEAELMAMESLRFGPTIDPLAALAVISAHCRQIEKLQPELAALGVTVNEQVTQETYALAEIAETEARAGGSSPTRGSRR
jgi:hypothetical protein